MQRCTLMAEQKSRTHKVRECKIYKDKRDVLEEMRKIDECDMESLVRKIVARKR